MNMKKTAIFAIAVLLLVPVSVSASKFTASKLGEQVVEGHTVFTVLEKRNIEQGFDIVIKVRERQQGPNVLWFNDQWKTFFSEDRQPCGGYVVATPSGVPLNQIIAQGTIVANGIVTTYVESYHITDPNGAVWDTDLYALTGFAGGRTIPVWVSSVHNAEMDDDGILSCAGIQDLAAHDDPGEFAAPLTALPYYDNVNGVPIREYNADIFGLWADVPTTGVKVHGSTSADGTGCEAGTEWECGAGGDDAEGNSHPYNPTQTGPGPEHIHATGSLDVFFYSTQAQMAGLFGIVAGVTGPGYPPAQRNYVVFDSEVVESEISPCNTAGFYNFTASPGSCGLGVL